MRCFASASIYRVLVYIAATPTFEMPGHLTSCRCLATVHVVNEEPEGWTDPGWAGDLTDGCACTDCSSSYMNLTELHAYVPERGSQVLLTDICNIYTWPISFAACPVTYAQVPPPAAAGAGRRRPLRRRRPPAGAPGRPRRPAALPAPHHLQLGRLHALPRLTRRLRGQLRPGRAGALGGARGGARAGGAGGLLRLQQHRRGGGCC